MNNVQWWCFAQGTRWSWSWRAYPGVWLFVLLVGALVWRATSRARRQLPPSARNTSGAVMAWSGVAILWLVLDWPIGPLAAGYLLWLHALQFLLIAFVVAPLLVRGMSSSAQAGEAIVKATGFRRAWQVALRATQEPVAAAIVFNVVVVATHAPSIVDSWMTSAIGAFTIDAAWLVAGVLFWRPVFVAPAGRHRLNTPMTMLYLILGTLFHTVIAMVMLVREFPMYAVYELAPPSFGMTAMTDQQLAGGIMELGGAAIIIGYLTVLFFRWAARDAG